MSHDENVFPTHDRPRGCACSLDVRHSGRRPDHGPYRRDGRRRDGRRASGRHRRREVPVPAGRPDDGRRRFRTIPFLISSARHVHGHRDAPRIRNGRADGHRIPGRHRHRPLQAGNVLESGDRRHGRGAGRRYDQHDGRDELHGEGDQRSSRSAGITRTSSASSRASRRTTARRRGGRSPSRSTARPRRRTSG